MFCVYMNKNTISSDCCCYISVITGTTWAGTGENLWDGRDIKIRQADAYWKEWGNLFCNTTDLTSNHATSSLSVHYANVNVFLFHFISRNFRQKYLDCVGQCLTTRWHLLQLYLNSYPTHRAHVPPATPKRKLSHLTTISTRALMTWLVCKNKRFFSYFQSFLLHYIFYFFITGDQSRIENKVRSEQ